MTKAELEKENERLTLLLNKQETELIVLRSGAERVAELERKYLQRLSDEYWAPKKNERGAGRKPKLTDELISEVKRLSMHECLSQRQIAEKLKISLGLVNKAVNSVCGEPAPMGAAAAPH